MDAKAKVVRAAKADLVTSKADRDPARVVAKAAASKAVKVVASAQTQAVARAAETTSATVRHSKVEL